MKKDEHTGEQPDKKKRYECKKNVFHSKIIFYFHFERFVKVCTLAFFFASNFIV